MKNLKICLVVLSSVFTTAALAADAYEPPRTASGKPNFQGYWTNASLTNMQRPSHYGDTLVIDPENLAEVTANHPQNVRQATDDGLVQG